MTIVDIFRSNLDHLASRVGHVSGCLIHQGKYYNYGSPGELYMVGGLSKTMIGYVVQQLVLEKKVSLSDMYKGKSVHALLTGLSDQDYTTLTQLIAETTGKSYTSGLESYLLDPLRMTSTTSTAPIDSGYRHDGNRAAQPGVGSLDMRSCLTDLTIYTYFTINDSVHPDIGGSSYGWVIDGPVYYRSGNTEGYSAFIGWSGSTGIVVLANRSMDLRGWGRELLTVLG